MRPFTLRSSYLLLLYTFVALVLVCDVHAKADLYKFFTTPVTRYMPGTNEGGGCKDHVADLENSYKEASAMIDAAVAALATVKQNPRPKFFKPKDRWNWDRQAQAVTSIFGVKISSKGGPATDSKENLDNFAYVEGIFNKMKAGMDNDEVENSAAQSPGLYCGTSGWKHIKPEEDDPLIAGKKLKDRIYYDSGKTLYPTGAWYYQGNLFNPKFSTPTDNTMCRPSVLAEAYPAIRIITWCDLGLTKLVKILDPKDIKSLDALNMPKFGSMSQTWVHELAHFYGGHSPTGGTGLLDEQSVDNNGNPRFNLDGTPIKTYGMGDVLLLAKYNPDAARKTADAFGWFAVAMYLSDWNWSKGFASSFL